MMDSIFAGMQPKIGDRNALQKWLDGLPDERRRQAAAVIAARAVLRTLPAYNGSLSYFRASALAWVAARYPARAGELPAYTGAFPALSAAASVAAGDAYAADIAVTASLASRDGDFWHLVSADVVALEEGRSPSALAGEPLIPKNTPSWTHMMWGVAAENIMPKHWKPWKDWYQRRLYGKELSEEIELLFATLPMDPNTKDPAEPNGLLAQAIERLMLSESSPREPLDSIDRAIVHYSVDAAIAHTAHSQQKPVVPKPRPAAIEPICYEGRIQLPKQAAGADLDARALNAALRALKQQFVDLVNSLDADSNIDKRATESLRRLIDLIPTKRPTQEQLFRLAHEQEKLNAYAASVVAEWPSTLAADYLAATRAFDRTVRQFPKWREFKANAEKDRLTPEQRDATPRIAAEFAHALRETEVAEFIEQEIASIVSDMASRLAAQREPETARFDPIAAGADLLAEDLITSIQNIVKTIAEAAISTTVGVAGAAKHRTKKLASRAGKSIDKELDRLADGVGPALTRWSKRVLFGVLPVATAGYGGVKTGMLASVIRNLMHTYPQFEWLQSILDFLS